MKFCLICGVCVLGLLGTSIIADVVTVQPADSFSTVLGTAGWQPALKTYSITNTVTDYVYWQASTADGMVDCQPAGSWIAPGASVSIQVGPGSSMGMVSAGTYTDQLTLDFEPRILGDIDGGGYVNVGDLQTFVARWNSTASSPGYDPAADLNSDGYVNVGDLQLLVRNWGKSYGATSL